MSLLSNLFTKKFWLSDVLIGPKLINFTLFMLMKGAFAYRCQFFIHEFNIQTREYALLVTILSLISFMSAPFWTFVTDRLQRPKLMLLVTSIMMVLSFSALKLVPKKVDDETPTFLILTLVTGILSSFSSALNPIVDRICLMVLTETEGFSRELYGRQRLFGSFGEMFANTVTGLLVGESNYMFLFMFVYGAELLFMINAAIFVPRDQKKKRTQDEEVKCPKKKVSVPVAAPAPPHKNNVVVLFTNWTFIFVMLVGLINGLNRSIGSHFVDSFMEDQVDGLGFEKHVIGIAKSMGNLMEVLMFFFAQPLTARFGNYNMMIGSQIAMIIRMTIHSSLPTGTNTSWHVYMAALAEAFKGLSFGMMMSSGVMVAAKEAPPELQATAQGVFSGIYHGLAPAMAGFLGWLLIDNDVEKISGESKEIYHYRRKLKIAEKQGPFHQNSGIFRLSVIFSFLALLLLFVQTYIDRQKKSRRQPIKSTKPASSKSLDGSSIKKPASAVIVDK
jgi:MFS family permease